MKIISIHCYKKYFHLKVHYYLKKIFSSKINKLSTTDNIFNGKPSDLLYTGYLNKEISVGDIVYFEPKTVNHR